MIPRTTDKKKPYVLPLASVLVSASLGLLTFLSYKTGSAEDVFTWLANAASVASVQAWAAMLFTYIRCASYRSHPARENAKSTSAWSWHRWYQGTVYYEQKYKDQNTPEARKARGHIEDIKKSRMRGQPYVSLPEQLN